MVRAVPNSGASISVGCWNHRPPNGHTRPRSPSGSVFAQQLELSMPMPA